MAIKNIIAKGIGFSPGTFKWIVTHGFSAGISTNSSVVYRTDLFASTSGNRLHATTKGDRSHASTRGRILHARTQGV